MYIVSTIIVYLFVIGVLAVVAWSLFKMSPFAHHVDQFRDEAGKWIAGEPLRLD